ncbi:hypothetical protein PV08_02545 [Exophiala spinifera]|uniref:PLD phosphodiesterase domain-containing protein n=1 Tax=Exophiala spinifera TaxID=91928 RepID=A0A0D1ZZU4_9EURO|nr:uncharacterized protein PV08_02545 [Exophiala spinifera]KIW18257.1 hypothetical protein PV08_02545 [Exophiala spinifera]
MDYADHVLSGRRAQSTPVSLTTGTGYSVFKSLVIPSIANARKEVILATCFWAPSATRDGVRDALVALSNRALETSCRITVRICFSSSSLARNMLWPTPKDGQNYSPTQWAKLLGLSGPADVRGLDLAVTRKFFWPFGIIHSKYVIVDRKLAIFPSCNVSWERWFEVAVAIKGPVVQDLIVFHKSFWRPPPPSPTGRSTLVPIGECERREGEGDDEEEDHGDSDDDENVGAQLNPGSSTASSTLNLDPSPTVLLPSPHKTSLLPFWCRPRALVGQCPCMTIPSSSASEYSQTPLLCTTHHLLSTARSSITMLTPNLTEPTVLDAIREALRRGVGVRVWTNRNLMTAEQMVTAGTTTPACVRNLRRTSRGVRGQLDVRFFDDHVQRDTAATTSTSTTKTTPGVIPPGGRETTPVKLHAKVTIVDDDKILLGSGNMDAASWRTSQELGVLIESRAVIERFKKEWKHGGL